MLLPILSLAVVLSRDAAPESLAAHAVAIAIADPAAAVSFDRSPLEEVLKRYECVTLIGTSAAPELVSGSLEVVMVTAEAAATLPLSHAEGEFPEHWRVTLRRTSDAWHVERVAVAETAVADAIAAAPDASARSSIVRESASLITPELARRISERADVLDATGQSKLAAELAQLARTIAVDCGSRAEEARALWALARTNDTEDHAAAAMNDYQQAHAVAEKAGDLNVVAATLAGMGAMRRRIGKTDGIAELSEAYRLAVQLSNRRVAALSLFKLGTADENAGNYAEALRKFTDAARDAEAAGDRVTYAATLAETGVTYDYMNNHSLAYDFMHRGIDLYRRLGNMRGVIRNLRNLADMEASDGRPDDAERHLRETEKLLETYPNPRTSAYIAGTRADMAIDRHDIAAAERASIAGLAYARQAGVEALITAFTRNMASIRLEQKRYDEAIALARETIERTRTTTANFDTYWHTQLVLGKAFFGQGKLNAARDAYSEAIAAVEHSRNTPTTNDDQLLFFADKDVPYYEIFRTYIDEDPAEAVLWAERARARTLLDFLTHGRRTVSAGSLSDPERREEEGVEKKIVDLNLELRKETDRQPSDAARLRQLEENLEGARRERAVLARRLYERHPDLALARGDLPLPSMDEVRNMIPADGMVVEYVTLPDRSWLVVLTRNKPPRIHPIEITAEHLRALCKQFDAQIAGRDIRIRSLSRKLFDLLLGPAVAELHGKKMICVVAQESLWNIPFQALSDRDGRYLVEKHAVFYAPSLAFLVWRGNHSHETSAPATVLAFGNPRISQATAAKARARFRDEALGPLPDAAEEVRALASAYGPRNSTVRIGSAATETEFKSAAQRYRILHVAAHGIYDDSNPMYSHLVLARTGNDANDGLLEAREIVDLRLNADLAVLSACESGRSEAHGGEGMVGLSWAFLAAGCRTELLVQLKVGSTSTRDLMVSFHRSLARRHSTAARAMTTALQHAQIRMLASGTRSHPFYWAPFIIVGEGW